MEPSQRETAPQVAVAEGDDHNEMDYINLDGGNDDVRGGVPTQETEYGTLDTELDELFASQLQSGQPPSMQEVLNGICGGVPSTSGAAATGLSSPPVDMNKRRMANSASALGQPPAKRSSRKSEASRLYHEHIDAVKETSGALKAYLAREEVSTSKPVNTTNQALDIVEELVQQGLIDVADPLWCFTVELMRDPERRDLFVGIKHNDRRVRWLQWLYDLNGGRP